MNKTFKFLSVFIISMVLQQVVTSTHVKAESTADVASEIKVNVKDEEANIIIMAHVKRKDSKDPYVFTFLVDGKEITESVKGEIEEESNLINESGEGMHYALIKKLKVKPGMHEIELIAENRHRTKVEKEVSDGKTYIVKFDPIYGPQKSGRPKHFREGVIGFKATVRAASR